MPTPFDRPPSWVSDAIFYQIFPDRFARSTRVPKPSNLEPWDSPPTTNGYKGGDLGGVLEHLDWISDLGCNAILFNPIFRSASNHRYHTHDYYVIDPLLGDSDLLGELLDACHGRGIRVVLDGVFNHASRGFFQFHDLLENGGKSPWIDWFVVKEFPLNAYHPNRRPGYEAWSGHPALPKFNTDDPDVREYLFGVAEHWARAGIDGWRLDVATDISTPGFWEEFRTRVRAVNPDLYIVAEIWGDASEWTSRGDRFDGTMNYLFGGSVLAFTGGSRIVPETVRGRPYPATPPLDAAGYRAAIDRIRAAYPEPAALANLNLYGSHDTARVRSVVGRDLASVELAVLLLMTFPGAPCVYYGDEIGMAGGQDPESRGAFPWDRPSTWDTTTLTVHRELIALRRAHPALRSPDYRSLDPDPGEPGELYCFLRSSADEQLLVAVNAGETEARAMLAGFAAPAGTLWGSGSVSATSDGVEVVLPARAGAVWSLTTG